MVQVPLAAKVEGLRGQLLVCPKSPGLVPVKPMLVMVSAVPLGFESVTALAVLVMPTLWLPKSGTGEGERLGEAIPVPDTPAVWGLLLALSVTVNVALREPVAVGVKVRSEEHTSELESRGQLVCRLLLGKKYPGLVPVKPILVMVCSATLASATVIYSLSLHDALPILPKSGTGEGERLGEAIPVPDTPAVWGLLLALSVTVNVALREPVAVGVKVTLIVQVPLAARDRESRRLNSSHVATSDAVSCMTKNIILNA